jgi:hypothetical protein
MATAVLNFKDCVSIPRSCSRSASFPLPMFVRSKKESLQSSQSAAASTGGFLFFSHKRTHRYSNERNGKSRRSSLRRSRFVAASPHPTAFGLADRGEPSTSEFKQLSAWNVDSCFASSIISCGSVAIVKGCGAGFASDIVVRSGRTGSNGGTKGR